MDVPDAFYGPYQSCPLDIVTQDFYRNRTVAINERLAWINNTTKQVHTIFIIFPIIYSAALAKSTTCISTGFVFYFISCDSLRH